MPQVKVIAKNLMDMVASLPATKLDHLYHNAFICLAILRSLPPLAKKYVLQMLYIIDTPISAKSMKNWVPADGELKHRVAIDKLVQLRLITETVDSGGLPREPMRISGMRPSLVDLDAYASEQWESFLLHLVSSTESETRRNISSTMRKIFQRGLLSERDGEVPMLTESGFQFLLMDTNAQLWYVIREYITYCEEQGVDTSDLISFLLELSFHVFGEARLSNTRRSIVKDLTDLGLLKLQQGMNERWFFPTNLAINLSISLSDVSSRKQGYVVVETNFRLYAYTTSKLHCEILRLFARIEYQLPNLIVGAITKEILYKAFQNGITADQIICFLQQNAHPRVAEKVPSVPENVTDQIRLWESDLNRVEMTPSHLYDEFSSRDAFKAACDFVRKYGDLLWIDSVKMRLIVKAETYDHMKKFVRQKQ